MTKKASKKEEIRDQLEEIALILVKAFKIFVVYILPSAIVTFLLSEELGNAMVNYSLLNTFLVILGQSIKTKLPDSRVSKIL